METLKFLHITTHYPPSHIGGDAKYVENLSNELVRMGHEVHVFHNPSVFGLIRRTEVEAHDAVTEAGVHRHAHKVKNPGMEALIALNACHSKSSIRRLDTLLKGIKPDVVHWHNAKGFFTIPVETSGAVSLYTAHDYFAVCPRSGLLRPGFKNCTRPFLCQTCLLRWKKPTQLCRIGSKRVLRFPRATKVICPSEFMARRLELDGIKIHRVLRNFVPDMRRKNSPESERKSLLYVGLLEWFKGPETLVKAFIRSKGKHDFRLWILGEGSLKEPLRRMIADSGLSQRVEMPGFVSMEDATYVHRQTAAMVVPSELSENAPLNVLEAFSLGIPVLGSNAGGLPEILGPQSGSSVYAAGDPERLADAITDLWNHRDELKDRGRQARAAYERDFNPSVHLKQYLDIVSESRGSESGAFQ